MRKFIERVTVTGADDSVRPEDIYELSKQYPWVEWGILLSKSSTGKNRFPSQQWLEQLSDLWTHSLTENIKFTLSGHICGEWVRDICKGEWTILDELPNTDMFERFQLNFHALVHKLDVDKFVAGFQGERQHWKQFIFQLDDVNNSILDKARDAGINASGLFDLSGGLGILPSEWPISADYVGYAGGLSPDNVRENIEKIEKVAPDRIWIDVETHVRSTDDAIFDLEKVRKFLENSKDFVLKG